MNIKTPLRYPGGKSKLADQIINRLPLDDALEYREPFIGGGSVFIKIRQRYPAINCWINDLNPNVYAFWYAAKNHSPLLVAKIRDYKDSYSNGKALFNQLRALSPENISLVEKAARFFILNRITFSGLTEFGGFSQDSFVNRFTDSSINRLEQLERLLEGVEITNHDYSVLVTEPGDSVVLYLDPPYHQNAKTALYANHADFEHTRLESTLMSCQHPWLVTYDNSPYIQGLYSRSYQNAWAVQYGMSNTKEQKAVKGAELILSNYKLSYFPSHPLHDLAVPVTY